MPWRGKYSIELDHYPRFGRLYLRKFHWLIFIILFVQPNPPERSLKDLQDDILVTKTIEMLWAKYDVDGNGYLDRNETKRFVVDSMKEMGMPTAGITDQLFEDTFREYDSDSSG